LVSPTPAPNDAVAWFPQRLWTPFPCAEARFLVVLDPIRRNHLVPPASPTSKLYSPCESVRTEPGFPSPEVDSLLGFRLPRAFSPHLGSSDPPRSKRPEHPPSPEGLGTRLKRPCSLSSQARPHLGTNASAQLPRRIPIPFETGPNRLSAALLLPWPWTPAATDALTFEASKYVESDMSPQRPPTLPRFSASSTTS